MLRHWWVRVLLFVGISTSLRLLFGLNSKDFDRINWLTIGIIILIVGLSILLTWYLRRRNIVPALMDDDLPGVERALQNGADPNRVFNLPSKRKRADRDMRYTALHLAALADDIELAKLMVNWGADLNSRTRFRATPLFHACFKEHWDVARYLLDCGADPNLLPDSGRSPLMLAVEQRNIPSLQMLLKAGAALDAQLPRSEEGAGDTALHMAVELEHLPAIDLLLKAGADPYLPNAKGLNPAMLAVVEDRRRALEALLDNGVDPNRLPGPDSPALTELAYRYAGRGMVELLMARGAREIERDGAPQRSLLHLAAIEGDLTMARTLLEGGMSPNAPDGHGKTALHCAAMCGNQQRYEPLTAGKGWPEPEGELSQTTEARIIRLLLKHGASPAASDEEGDTPLHLAAHFENAAAVQALLSAGADVNARNKEDFTPLHEANIHAALASMRLLLAAGADPNARATYGRQPLDLLLYNAERLDKKLLQKVSEVMLAAGAKHGAAPGWVEEGKYGG
ncbi:ankyrin repeat domain-containing protein [bacterium]|nr:ankyrin repeat domain-containing protein [bacterium]